MGDKVKLASGVWGMQVIDESIVHPLNMTI